MLIQDSVRGGYDPKQSWSGAITQFNLWDFSMEEYHIEVMVENINNHFYEEIMKQLY